MYRLAVIKLTSCSGCINELVYALTANQDLLNSYEVTYFTEITDYSRIDSDVDLVFIEGSITNSWQEKLLYNLRNRAKFTVALGTCAVYGGVQSLRVGEEIDIVKRIVYPDPENIDVYSDVKSIDSIIKVDFMLPGCPVREEAITSFMRKYALGGLPILICESVCGDCKRRGIECVMVSRGIPCLGPVTAGGCGALCPSFNRGCYGCYGLKDFDMRRENLSHFIETLGSLGMEGGEATSLFRGYGFKTFSRLARG